MARVIMTVRVEEETAAWFKSNFPAHGSQQWFLESCVEKLREMHEKGEYEAPVDLLETTVREVVN